MEKDRNNLNHHNFILDAEWKKHTRRHKQHRNVEVL